MRRYLRFALPWAISVASAGCGGGDAPPPRSAVVASGESESLAPAAAAEGDEASPLAPRSKDSVLADRIVNDALTVVARLRELPPTGPVRGRMMERRKMVDHIRGKLRTEVPPHALEGTQELLVLLRLVPLDFDYESSLLELMGAQLAGFYETDDKTMYLAHDLDAMERRATLAHELVHALQDQHYDLGSKIDFADDGGDVQAALHALAEGDATSAMLDDMLRPNGQRATDLGDVAIGVQVRSAMALDPNSAAVPSILRQSIVAPYADGVVFVHALRRAGGWAAVDGAWKRPPESTEQILHPEKFAARESPVEVALPAASPEGPAKMVFHDVMGEQAVGLVLDEWLPRQPALEAAAGWSGDRVAVFVEGDRAAMGWHLLYDDDAAAQRLFEALRTGVRLGSKPSAAQVQPTGECRERADRGPIALFRAGRHVVLTAGPYDRTKKKGTGTCLAALAWASAMGSR